MLRNTSSNITVPLQSASLFRKFIFTKPVFTFNNKTNNNFLLSSLFFVATPLNLNSLRFSSTSERELPLSKSTAIGEQEMEEHEESLQTKEEKRQSKLWMKYLSDDEEEILEHGNVIKPNESASSKISDEDNDVEGQEEEESLGSSASSLSSSSSSLGSEQELQNNNDDAGEIRNKNEIHFQERQQRQRQQQQPPNEDVDPLLCRDALELDPEVTVDGFPEDDDGKGTHHHHQKLKKNVDDAEVDENELDDDNDDLDDIDDEDLDDVEFAKARRQLALLRQQKIGENDSISNSNNNISTESLAMKPLRRHKSTATSTKTPITEEKEEGETDDERIPENVTEELKKFEENEMGSVLNSAPVKKRK